MNQDALNCIAQVIAASVGSLFGLWFGCWLYDVTHRRSEP